MESSDPIRRSISVRKPESDRVWSVKAYFIGPFAVLATRKTDGHYLLIQKRASSIFFISLPRILIRESNDVPKNINVSERPDTHSKIIKPFIDKYTGKDFVILSHSLMCCCGMFGEETTSDVYAAIDSRHQYEIVVAFEDDGKRYAILDTRWCGFVLKEVHLDPSCARSWKGVLAHPDNYRYVVGDDERPLAEFLVKTKQ